MNLHLNYYNHDLIFNYLYNLYKLDFNYIKMTKYLNFTSKLKVKLIK